MTPEDILLAFSILLLGVEVIKATRMGIRGLMDHILSMILFIVMLVEFLLVARAGTSTFFILMVISLVDVLAGFIITARTAQRDIQIDRTVDPTMSERRPITGLIHEPRFPSARPLAGDRRRRHGRDLASAGDARRHRRDARRRQRGGRGGDRGRRAVRDRAAHDRHRRRLLRADRRARQAGLGLQRLRPLRRQGLDRGAARQGHRARSSRPRRTRSTCRARSRPGTRS